MKIARDNYETFFLDFLDGNLAEKDMDQFLDFLEQNPDLKEELQSLQQFRLADEQVVFPEKERLYKPQAEETTNRETKLVAYLEGDLEHEERKIFEDFLSTQPTLQAEYQLFTRTRMIPDTGIQYPGKRKLYRKPVSVIVMNWVARAAAVVLLVWGISSVVQNGKTPAPKPGQEIAQTSPGKELQAKTPEVKEQKLQENTVSEKTIRDEKSSAIRRKVLPEKLPVMADEPVAADRENSILAEILPIGAKLETAQEETQLAFDHEVKIRKTGEPYKVMGLQEFLAQRAEKVGKKGLLSVQHLARLGLGVASEISGERISYSEKNGKIASVGFESKLLAFTIPLEKK